MVVAVTPAVGACRRPAWLLFLLVSLSLSLYRLSFDALTTLIYGPSTAANVAAALAALLHLTALACSPAHERLPLPLFSAYFWSVFSAELLQLCTSAPCTGEKVLPAVTLLLLSRTVMQVRQGVPGRASSRDRCFPGCRLLSALRMRSRARVQTSRAASCTHTLHPRSARR